MIELRDVTRVFESAGGTVTAVDSVSLRVEAGETVCLIGTSGCGKTTTLKMINRLVEPTSGALLVDGEDVLSHDVIALRRRIGWVIQRGGIFPHRTVAQNVAVMAELEGWDQARTRGRVDELLELVNLDPARYRDRYPKELSGGQLQRVGIARALMLGPEIVLMDEPFGALDVITRHEVQREFRALQQALGKTVVMVTHDLQEAFELGDRIAVMDSGRLLQVGTPDQIRQDPADAFVRQFVGHHVGHPIGGPA